MTAGDLRWYVHRAARMSPGETAVRVRDQVRQTAWRARQVHPGQVGAPPRVNAERAFATVLDPAAARAVPEAARAALLRAADQLLTGQWDVLGTTRRDLDAPHWFYDPSTDRHAPADRYAFRIRYRSEAETGNVKQIWEVSRHQHLTVLAAAWYLTEDERYADAVAAQLRSWWDANPFLSGVHWTSGIEIALRLISWTWVRRLLDAWPGVADLFEGNDTALRQISWHQEYLAAFPSVGSSANNHVIAEAAGQLVACCAMPWFARTSRWKARACVRLREATAANTFTSGVNRELASEYHVFVAELLVLAAVESERAGTPLGASTWTAIARMVDAAAALLDETGRPPRQGDGDEGRALLVDGPESNRWSGLLAFGADVLGARPWWPAATPTVLSTLTGSLGAPKPSARGTAVRPVRRPAQFGDAGIVLLRTAPVPPSDPALPVGTPELWCRVDGGPHGFLSTAAHAHADALAIEVRHGGVDVLADPGTYCYHGEEQWRQFFRSTLGHNTLELGGRDQSRSGGPFMWVRHARTRVLDVVEAADGEIESWSGEHDGYADLDPPATHRRTVSLSRACRRYDIVDEVDTTGVHAVRLAFHFGPAVHAQWIDAAHTTLALSWPAPAGRGAATLLLPQELQWRTHHGDTEPVLGWYSPRFGVRTPATAVVGSGVTAPGIRWKSALVFHE